MSFIAAAAPLEETPSDLKTASFPAQRAANEDSAEGCARQYEISASVKFLVTNVGLFDGTAEISSVGYRQFKLSDAGVIKKADLDRHQLRQQNHSQTGTWKRLAPGKYPPFARSPTG